MEDGDLSMKLGGMKPSPASGLKHPVVDGVIPPGAAILNSPRRWTELELAPSAAKGV